MGLIVQKRGGCSIEQRHVQAAASIVDKRRRVEKNERTRRGWLPYSLRTKLVVRINSSRA